MVSELIRLLMSCFFASWLLIVVVGVWLEDCPCRQDQACDECADECDHSVADHPGLPWLVLVAPVRVGKANDLQVIADLVR